MMYNVFFFFINLIFGLNHIVGQLWQSWSSGLPDLYVLDDTLLQHTCFK